MKNKIILLLLGLFLGCDFDFIREEQPKEKIPLPYQIVSEFSFYHLYSNDYVFFGNSFSAFPRVSTNFITDDVKYTLEFVDALTNYEVTLIDEKSGIDLYNFRYNFENNKPSYSNLNDMNGYLKQYQSTYLKVKFNHPYYSDSITIDIPEPIRLVNLMQKIDYQTKVNVSGTDSVNYYILDCTVDIPASSKEQISMNSDDYEIYIINKEKNGNFRNSHLSIYRVEFYKNANQQEFYKLFFNVYTYINPDILIEYLLINYVKKDNYDIQGKFNSVDTRIINYVYP